MEASVTRPWEPEQFKVRVQRHTGTSLYVKWDGSELLCTDSIYGYAPEALADRYRPSEQEWAAFWDALERLGVWQWHEKYANDAVVLDGTRWAVEIRHGASSVASRATNAYPPDGGLDTREAFEPFVAVVCRLLGGREFR
jgi:hypothetical protein